MTRRILQVLLFLLLLVGAAAMAGILFITSPTGSAWLSSKLHETLQEQARLEVSFDGIELSLFPPRILLENLNARGVDMDVACTIDEAEVSPDPLKLLGGRLAIQEVFLGRPECRVEIDATDMARFRDASNIGDDTRTDLDLSFLPDFDVVAMSDGAFTVVVDEPDGIGKASLRVDGLFLDITGRSRNAAHIEIRMLLEKAVVGYWKDEVSLEEELREFEMRVGLDERAIDIRRMEGGGEAFAFVARNVHIPIPLRDNRLSAGHVSVTASLDTLNRLPLDVPTLDGTAGFEGQMSAAFTPNGVDVIARGEVSWEDGRVGDYVIGNARGQVSYSPRGVSVSDMVIETAGGTIGLDGSLALNRQLDLDATLALQDVELAQLLENLSVSNSHVQQQMTGRVEVSGGLSDFALKGRVDLDVADHVVFDRGYQTKGRNALLTIPRVQVEGGFEVDSTRLQGSRFVVRRGNSVVNVNMMFGFSKQLGWRLTARSSQFDLADVKDILGFEVGGTGQIECSIVDRNWTVPRIRANASIDRMQFAGFSFSHASSDIIFDGDDLIFENLQVRSRRSRYHAPRLVLDFDGPGGLAATTQVVIETAELSDLARSYRVNTRDWGEPKGRIRGHMDLEWAGGRDGGLQMSGSLEHSGLTLFNEVFGPGHIEAQYDKGNLVVERLDMKKGKGSVALSGTMSDRQDMNFTAVVTDVRIEDIAFPAVSDLQVEGVAQIFAVLEGTVAHPRGHANLRVSQINRKGVRYGPSELEFNLDNDRMAGRGTIGGRRLTVEHALFDFGRRIFQVEAFVNDLNVVDFARSDDLFMTPLAANLTGEMVLSGPMDDSGGITGMARFFEMEMGYGAFRVKNRNPVLLSVEKGTVQFDTARFLGDNIVFDLAGSSGPDSLSLMVKGLLNLRDVSRYVDPVSESEGTLSFDVLINGPWDNVGFRGGAEMSDAMFVVDGFPNAIRNVNGTVELGEKQIRFVDFSGSSAGGKLDADGWLLLDDLEVADYGFNLSFANLELELMDGLMIRTSSTNRGLSLRPPTLDQRVPHVVGDVEIERFRYTEPIQIIEISDLDMSRSKRRTRRPRILDQSKDVFSYDINLHGERNLSVINNLLDARFRIDDTEDPLRLVGTNQHMGFLGRVITRGGDVRFAGKTFEIRSGAIWFTDALNPENPSFRVTADVDIRDWKITITAEGTVEDYEVRVTSQPQLTKDDITMLLLTGMTRQEHQDTGSQGLSMSLGSLFENVSSGIIPVEVNVYREYSEKAETDTTMVALSRRIAQDVWVQVSSSIGQEQEVRGAITYRITDNVSVSANYDNRNETSKTGNWGLDLRFRLEF